MPFTPELDATGNKSLEEIDIDSCLTRKANIINIKSDVNLVLLGRKHNSFSIYKRLFKLLQITEDTVLLLHTW